MKPTPPNGVLHRYVAPQVRPVGQDTRRDHSLVGVSEEHIQSPAPLPTPRTTTITTAEVHHNKVCIM